MTTLKNPIDHGSELRKASKVVVTAATVDMVTAPEGVCQVCSKPMTLTRCGEIPVFACMDHRIVLPVRTK